VRIAVIGAAGRTGVALVERALEGGHEVVALARDPDGLPEAVRGEESLQVVEGDPYTGEGVAETIGGGGPTSGSDRTDPVDAVASVPGRAYGRPDDLLTEVGRYVLDAMRAAGVDRYVTLVGADVRNPGGEPTLGERALGTLLAFTTGQVREDAEAHVETVQASDTRWTVVRAPRLTGGAHTGDFIHGAALSLGPLASARRANVADFILYCLAEDLYIRELPAVADE